MNDKKLVKAITRTWKNKGVLHLEKTATGYIILDGVIMIEIHSDYLLKFKRDIIPTLPANEGDALLYKKDMEPKERTSTSMQEFLDEIVEDAVEKGLHQLTDTRLLREEKDRQGKIYYNAGYLVQLDTIYTDIFDANYTFHAYNSRSPVVIQRNGEVVGIVMPIFDRDNKAEFAMRDCIKALEIEIAEKAIA